MMLQNDRKIYYTLRFAAAMCFIGHGTFGIITKQIWCNYFAVFGIGHDLAYTLMPWLGSVDILMGISLLVYPTRAVLWWLIIWGTITAFLRPMSGEPFAEFIERCRKFLKAPLDSLSLILCNSKQGTSAKGWFSKVSLDNPVDAETRANVINCLRVIVFLLLVGHGWLNLIGKKGIMGQYVSLGFSNPAQVGQIVGIFEIVAACSGIDPSPLRPLIFVFFIWKMGTELFYPHWELFEWIERGGSYGALLALWLALPRISLPARNNVIAT